MKETPWKTAPISPTCEVMLPKIDAGELFCGAATSLAYPAMGGGWMALCACHGQKHLSSATQIDVLIRAGESFIGAPAEELAKL